jgi:hypothetical protein
MKHEFQKFFSPNGEKKRQFASLTFVSTTMLNVSTVLSAGISPEESAR